MTLSPEILEKAKEYGEKMRVLQGQYVGTAGRLTMAFEAGAAAMQDSKDERIKVLEGAMTRVVAMTRETPCLPDGVIQQCREALSPGSREQGDDEAKKEREFWIAKFDHWVKCQEEGPTYSYIKAQGFKDCANAMRENDRWTPYGQGEQGKGGVGK